MLKIPRALTTWPRPPQLWHVLIWEPGSAPEPSHTSQASGLLTVISFSHPRAASSKVIYMS
jgi:hypothetical protein